MPLANILALKITDHGQAPEGTQALLEKLNNLRDLKQRVDQTKADIQTEANELQKFIDAGDASKAAVARTSELQARQSLLPAILKKAEAALEQALEETQRPCERVTSALRQLAEQDAERVIAKIEELLRPYSPGEVIENGVTVRPARVAALNLPAVQATRAAGVVSSQWPHDGNGERVAVAERIIEHGKTILRVAESYMDNGGSFIQRK